MNANSRDFAAWSHDLGLNSKPRRVFQFRLRHSSPKRVNSRVCFLNMDPEKLHINELKETFQKGVQNFQNEERPLSDNPFVMDLTIEKCKDRFENMQAHFLAQDAKDRVLRVFSATTVHLPDTKDLKSAEEEADESRRVLTKIRAEGDALQKEAQTLVYDIVNQNNEAMRLDESNKELMDDLTELTTQIRGMEQEITDLRPERSQDPELDVPFDELIALQRVYQEQLDKEEMHAKEADEELIASRMRVEDLALGLQDAEKKLATLQAENDSLQKAQNELLVSDQRDLELASQYYNTMISNLRAISDFEITGIEEQQRTVSLAVKSEASQANYTIELDKLSRTVLSASADVPLFTTRILKQCSMFPPAVQLTAFLQLCDQNLLTSTPTTKING